MKNLKVLVCPLALLIPGVAPAQTSHGRIQTDRIADKSTAVITGATPDVSNRNIFKTNNGSPTTITNFANGVASQVITVICGEANTTIQNNLNIVTASGADIACTANKAQDFTYDASQMKWIQKSVGSAGGRSPAGNKGNVQLKNGPVFGAGGENDDTTFKVSRDQQSKGPNPYIDIRSFGARATTGTTPNSTASIATGTATATLAGSSTFVNGDGVVIRGAGANITLSTPKAPRVVAGNATVAVGIGQTVPNSSGSTTYQYQIVARTVGGGYTVASTATAISNGPASLGANTVHISSWTRKTNVVTVTTASAHNLVVGSLVNIKADGPIMGWYNVSTVPDNTHFTVVEGTDARNGAATSGGSTGQVLWWNCNEITWAHVAGAWAYYIYGRTSGSMTLLGVSLPDRTQINVDALYNVFEDYGATMTIPPDMPDWVPSTPPVAVKNDDLVTTIISGAGTTTLTLAANASNTVSGAIIKLDNAPNIAAAVAATFASDQKGVLYIPAGNTLNNAFVTNSVLTMQGSSGGIVAVKQAGSLFLGDTLVLGNAVWSGDSQNPLNLGVQFSFQKLPVISSGTAMPVVYESLSNVLMSYVSITNISNSGVGLLIDGNGQIPASQISHVNIGSPITDFVGHNLVIRNQVNGASNFHFDFLSMGSGPSITDNSPSPLFVCNNGMALATFRNIFLNRRGMLLGGSGNTSITSLYEQGAIMPKISLYNPARGITTVSLTLDVSEEDTTTHPILAYYGGLTGIVSLAGSNGLTLGPNVSGNGTVAIQFRGVGANTANIGQGVATEASLLTGEAIDGVFNAASGQSYPEKILNAGLSVGSPYQMFVNSNAQAAPTAAVSAGGTVALGTYTFQVAPVFASGGEGVSSPSSNSVTTTSGHQTITVTWATVPGAIGYDLYHDHFSFQCSPPWITGGGVTSYVWSGTSACGQAQSGYSGSGPTAMLATGLFAPQLTLPSTDGGGNVTVKMPVGTATRTLNLPDATGTALLAKGWFTNPNHLLITRADGTVQDSGVAPMAVFDSGNRANGTIQSGNPNWVNHANFSGGVNVVGNSFVGGTRGTSGWVLYTGASFPTDDQTVAATITGVGASAHASTSVLLRASPTVSTGYSCSYSVNGTSNLSISKEVRGTFTSLSSLNYSAAAGDKLSCNVTGTTLNLYVNGVRKIGPITDASISSGFPGLGFFSNLSSLTLSNWAASYGAVSLNVAQTWGQLQTFASGVKLGAAQSLTGAGGNAAIVTTQSAPLTAGKVLVGDANNNASPARGSGTLGVTIPRKMLIIGALCDNATARPAWSIPSSSAPSANCNTGRNVQEATLDFADGNSAQYTLYLPSDWTGAIDARLMFFDSSTSGTVIFQIATACTATSGSSNDDLAFSTADSFSTITLNAKANALWEATKPSINTTGCQPGNKLQIKITRATDTAAGAARFSALELTTRAAI